MRMLLASVVAVALLALFFPVLCVQGEGDPGSCSSVLGLRVPGTADQAEWWQLVVLVAAVVAFVVILRGRPRGSDDVDMG